MSEQQSAPYNGNPLYSPYNTAHAPTWLCGWCSVPLPLNWALACLLWLPDEGEWQRLCSAACVVRWTQKLRRGERAEVAP